MKRETGSGTRYAWAQGILAGTGDDPAEKIEASALRGVQGFSPASRSARGAC